MTVKKTMAAGAGKLGRSAGRTSARAASMAGKAAMDRAPDFETSSKWLVRIVTTSPQYLKFYFKLLTDDRVSHKVKALLVTAIALLGANFAVGGILYQTQLVLSYVLGPFAFLPTILILLITLDICYTLIGSDIMDAYEKTILGEENSLQADIQRLREFMGDRYVKISDRWIRKAEKVEEKMRQEGQIVDGEFTDEALQDAVDQLVELETSPKLQAAIQGEAKRLGGSDRAGEKALEEFDKKLLD